ncbi:MAG TPA: DUF3426 domain-containing protein [Terriglobia bacterium]|jgi:hypothetical protein
MGEHRSTIIIAASLVLVVGLIAAWVFVVPARDPVAAAPVVEVSDSAAVHSSTQLTHLSIATSENFARQKIYVISAHLKNASDKPMRMAEVKMTFNDYDGKPIHEYTQKVLDRNQKPLLPGTEFRFEIRQENLPRTWNYHVPDTEITKVGY